ncbi:MAG TPA: hypothetical protein VFG10_06370 [Saprospiraceae bacterium]|nr:hypothetical protein [Saprospiraceae bacterium]
MKTVLMIMFLLGGLSMQQADAQKCVIPCTPGCCIKSYTPAKGSAAAATTDQTFEATFASFMLAAAETTCQPKPGATAEVKCAPAACKSNVMPSSTCKPTTAVAASTAACLPAASAPTRVKEKS